MGKTIADALREEGELVGLLRGKRQMLLEQLRARFKTLPDYIETAVQSETDVGRIDAWAKAFATARKLSDIPFPSPR